MRLSSLILFFSLLVAVTYSAPAVEKDNKVVVVEEAVVDADVPATTVSSVDDEQADSTDADVVEDATTLSPTRDGRQLENDDASSEDEAEDDDDDDEEEEDEEEEEEEAARNQVVKTPKKTAGKNKKTAETKPVPVLGEGGVEDDEAEDLGIFEREEPKSDEKASDEKESDEEQKDDEKDESQEDESAEDEERDEPSGPSGLVAEPGSSERGDVDDIVPQSGQNEVEQPLAIAVVQHEEEPNVPVVPVIVEDNAPAASEQTESKTEATRKNKPKKEKDDEDDDDDDEDEDEDEEEEEEAAARSEKVSRSAGDDDVLYYYPYPASPVIPQITEEFY